MRKTVENRQRKDNAVVKSRDIPICKLLAKCREMISLVDFVGKSVTLHLLMNINELVLLP